MKSDSLRSTKSPLTTAFPDQKGAGFKTRAFFHINLIEILRIVVSAK
jgi:hypothetical protein